MNKKHQVSQINESLSIRSGITSTLVLAFTNNYFSLFAISALSATNYQVGLISSLPQFIGMFGSLLAAWVVSRVERKKTVVGLATIMTRLFLIPMALVVYLPADVRVWVFVGLIGLMNLPGSFMNLSWQTLIGDLISVERRNDFFSTRNRWMTIISMISTLILGIVLAWFDKGNPAPYQILFLIAFGFGIMEATYIWRHRETNLVKEVKETTNRIRTKLLSNIPYRKFLIGGLYFNFAWQMAWSLFSIYQIKYAGATGFWVSLFVVANQISQVVSFKWWGRMAGKVGNVQLLVFVAFGMATAPLLTILSTNLIYQVSVNLLTGFFVAGTVLLLFNQLLEVSGEAKRTSYIANYNTWLAVIGFIAPQFGVFLLEQFGMNVAMLTSFVLRASSGLVFLYLFREEAMPFVKKVAALTRNKVASFR